MVRRKDHPRSFLRTGTQYVEQQVSGKTAQNLFDRLNGKAGGITPENILEAGDRRDAAIAACRLGKQVISGGIAEAAIIGAADFDSLKSKTDREIIETLTKLRGCRVWTAEMLLDFLPSKGRMS